MPPRTDDSSDRQARVLLVTGASSGIGLATALLAGERGDHLVLVARDEGSLTKAARQCDEAGAASTLALPADVGDDAAVADVVLRTVDEHGRIDAVAHCAGVVAYGRVESVPPEVFEGVLRTNLLGSINVVRHVIPLMRAQRHGSIVLIGSVVGHLAVPGMAPYVLSKWGVRVLARQLQIENRDVKELRVSYLAPGGVLTPIYEQAANYSGWAGRPPPPVASPHRVARVVLTRLERPRDRTQVGLANNVMRFGFTAMPKVYDAVVGPAFRLGATNLTRRLPPVAGNVLASQPELNRLLGDQSRAVVGIGRNVIAEVRRRTGTGGF
jgi:NAD(P)-dependent dehydrogenase (short-subunit alcohol dehydrogenase family)